MSNEITVKISCSLEEIYKILKEKGFLIIDKYNLEDIFFITKDIDIKKQSIRKILTEYILIRKVIQFIPNDFVKSNNFIKLTYKNKNIADDGTIISQNKKECEIKNLQQGKEFLEALGYIQVMTIKEQDIVYAKGDYKLSIKNIENGDKLLEVETIEDNDKFNTTDKLIQEIKKLKLPIDESNFFVKKAEIEFKKIY